MTLIVNEDARWPPSLCMSIDSWLRLIEKTAPQDCDLAVEAPRMRGLVKGYGDTHARGRDKFDLLTAQLPKRIKRRDGVALIIEMYRAALVDESGNSLTVCGKTWKLSHCSRF